MNQVAHLTPDDAYRQRKIRLAASGMKIALLLPVSAILQNIFNSSVTETVYSSLQDKVILSIICSITLIAMCDIFAGIFTFIYNAAKGKGIQEYKRTVNLKISWMMLLAAGFAGPLATGCWMAATPFCGLTTVAVVTSLGPILTAFISRFILKEHLSGRAYIGIIITVVGVILSGWVGFSQGGSNFLLGFILALMAPIGFTLEGQASTYAGDMIDPNVGCGFYRCFGSGILGLLAMLLVSGVTGNVASYGLILKMVLTTPILLIFVVIMGLFGAINYNAAYLAFNRTGPSRTLAVDSSRPIWSIPLGFLFAAFGIAPYSVSTMVIGGAILAAAGLLLVISKPSDLVNLRNVN
mgnify:CR=1 FL=1